jgi:Tfp pilus assembly protein PilF
VQSRGAALGLFVVLTGLVPLGAPLQSAAALPRDPDKWLLVESDHFQLYSNTSRRKATQIAANLETLRAVLVSLAPGHELRAPRPTLLFVFKDSESFRDYGTWVNSSPGAFPGFFLARADANYVAMDASVGDEPERILYHEYLHTILDSLFPDLPLWFNEGLAEYYSTFEIHGDKAQIGRPVQHHLEWLRMHGVMPLEQLFATTSRSEDYNEVSIRSSFYAQSWAVVHYLLTASAERRAQTSRYLALVGQGEPMAQAFAEAFGTEPGVLLQEVWSYVQRSKLEFSSVPAPEFDADKMLRTTSLSQDEAYFHLGDLLQHITPKASSEAEKHFDAALKVNPRHAGALCGLGWVAEIEHDDLKARERYEAALSFQPTDYRIYLNFGRLLLNPLMRISFWRLETDPGTEATLRAARAAFRRCIALKPDCAEGYAAWGATYLFETTVPNEAIEALVKAFSMQPSRTDIACDLVVLFAKRGDRKGAQRWLDQVLRPKATPGIISKAEEALLLIDVADARGLLDKGRVSDGMRLLDSVLSSTSDSTFRADVESLRDRAAGADGPGHGLRHSEKP